MPSENAVVMAFSLDARSAAYVNGAGRGRKSALVRRAIHGEMHRQLVLDDVDLRKIWKEGSLNDTDGDSIFTLADIIQSRDKIQEELIDANDKVEYLERKIAATKLWLKSEEKLDEISGSSQIPDDEAQKVSPSRGLKRFFKFLWA